MRAGFGGVRFACSRTCRARRGSSASYRVRPRSPRVLALEFASHEAPRTVAGARPAAAGGTLRRVKRQSGATDCLHAFWASLPHVDEDLGLASGGLVALRRHSSNGVNAARSPSSCPISPVRWTPATSRREQTANILGVIGRRNQLPVYGARLENFRR